jgi:hypothetical protein
MSSSANATRELPLTNRRELRLMVSLPEDNRMKIVTLLRLAAPGLLCFSALAAVAQDDAASAGASLAGCGCCSTFIAIPIVIIALNIAILVWVARDAKARGMDSAVLWMLLVFFTSFIGLIIYILSRPQGNLVPCPNCGNKKLQASVRCPHCGAGSAVAPTPGTGMVP